MTFKESDFPFPKAAVAVKLLFIAFVVSNCDLARVESRFDDNRGAVAGSDVDSLLIGAVISGNISSSVWSVWRYNKRITAFPDVRPAEANVVDFKVSNELY